MGHHSCPPETWLREKPTQPGYYDIVVMLEWRYIHGGCQLSLDIQWRFFNFYRNALLIFQTWCSFLLESWWLLSIFTSSMTSYSILLLNIGDSKSFILRLFCFVFCFLFFFLYISPWSLSPALLVLTITLCCDSLSVYLHAWPLQQTTNCHI